MDYKEKYEQGLECIQEILSSGQEKIKMTLLKERLQPFFPELDESEDELTWLTKFIEEEAHSLSMDIRDNEDRIKLKNLQKSLAWLEKQKAMDKEIVNTVKGTSILDMVEPKFNVGDFILNGDVTNDGKPEIFKIQKICPNWYDVENIYDGRKTIITFNQEWSCKLWNIKDAEDGDVIACNEEILLFKSYSVQGRISLYCWYNERINNFYSKEVNDASLTTKNKICPATKEQRDTLFKKMKEAGYQWDAEKKELKLLISNGGDF